MTTTTLTTLLGLSTLCALASAAPTPPTPPTPPGPPVAARPAEPACTRGATWIEERLELAPNLTMNVVNVPTYQITVFEGGAWERHDVDASGRHPVTTSGCLSRAHRDALAAALHSLPWSVHPNPRPCSAAEDSFTSYRIRGVDVWAAHACSAQLLDDASAKAVALITDVLATETVPHPPCCKR